MTVKLFTQGWLLFKLPLLLNSLEYYTPLPASWCPNKTVRSVDLKMKEQNVHEDCGIFVHVWTDCMNYLKYILVNDISTESIEVEKKNITFFFVFEHLLICMKFLFF